MQPGWYAHIQNPGAVAYFDGTAWGTAKDGFALGYEIQQTITPLQPGHPGPPAPFETLTVTGPRKRKPGSAWFWGIGGGAALICLGLLNGFMPAGSNCGAPFKKSSVAEYMDALSLDNGLGYTGYAAECRASIADATALTWVLVVIGVIVLLASFLIQAVIRSGQSNRPPAAPAEAPTVASQIEDLARLRDKGLVTPEEFEWKRQDLLRRS
ncbi:SHOCT domain-containing protein [Arthrobacter sp. ISL-72]|uniref:SHOCT domain-containing protein n=1 Tax=Arthrobacter sp. ISL-72 TaxID=2819114 RepID=UPI001BE55992|nr:SHOCT domain-containing protein [Arthrobacter sp. ISL-72]MBT2594067.1 SHOCT domain-containing protein [Arthrobacter sp. ISL-72]